MHSSQQYKCINCAAPIDVKNFFGIFSCQYCGTTQRYLSYNFIEDPIILGGQVVAGSFDLVDALREMRQSYNKELYQFSRSEAADILRHHPDQIDAICCIILSDMHLNLEGRGVEFYRRVALDVYGAYRQKNTNDVLKFIEEVLKIIIGYYYFDIRMINSLIILSSLCKDDRYKILERWCKGSSDSKHIWPEVLYYPSDRNRIMHKICDSYGSNHLIEHPNTSGYKGVEHWVRYEHITPKHLSYLGKLNELAFDCGWTWGRDPDQLDGFNFYIYDSERSAPQKPTDYSNIQGCGCLIAIVMAIYFPIQSCAYKQKRRERIESLLNYPGEIRRAHCRAMETWGRWNNLRHSKPGPIYAKSVDQDPESEIPVKIRDHTAEAEAHVQWRKEVAGLQKAFEKEKQEYDTLLAELADLQKR